MVNRSDIETWYRDFQAELCAALERLDGSGSFRSELWDRPGGGGGDTRLLVGSRLEKAAVNFSAVFGPTPVGLGERMAAAGNTFYATGVSVIVHPANPYAPTFHANVRYFETDRSSWFGGGADLTPWYLFPEDCAHFHGTLRDVCRRHHAVADYDAWKSACDEYFFLPHRGEARGVGGIFFDHLEDAPEDVWAFQRDLAAHTSDAYLPLLERRCDLPYGEEQRTWQERRRGRYTEFNLVWDRGTRFGLETGGRAASILASLPPSVRWDEEAEPAAETREAELLAVLRGRPVDWALQVVEPRTDAG